MMNKRGSMIDLYTVVLTLLMCGLVLWGFANGTRVLSGSIVSPLPVLQLSEEIKDFEGMEEDLIGKTFDRVSSDFSSSEFADEFEEEFFSGMGDDMKDFLVGDLYLNGRFLERGDFDEGSFFENVYSFDFEGAYFRVIRKSIGKRFELKAEDVEHVDFPVWVDYSFQKEYLIDSDGKVLEDVE